MNLSRREFAGLMGLAGFAGLLPSFAHSKQIHDQLYKIRKFGQARLLHFTDTHAQLNPIYFREPSINLGIHQANGKAPHLVGSKLLNHFNIEAGSAASYALSHINFQDAAHRYGKVGGFAHLKTLIDQLRSEYDSSGSLLLDGGDTWQGSGTALWTRGKDMVGASNLLGVDIMTGHWEFTYSDKEVLENIKEFKGEFLAQNIRVSEEALFEDAQAFDKETGHAFKPYTIKELNGHRIAVIGQAFPYTPIANPKRFIPDWSFGIREQELQQLVELIKATEKTEAIVLLSHNGMDVDLKMAENVCGIDIILGGHTHDGIPQAIEVKNDNGITLVTNAGSNGKFLGVMDLSFANGKINDYRYKLLPIFSNLIAANKEMQSYVEQVRRPFLDRLQQPLGIAGQLLYRRGNFNGTFDQIICDSLTTFHNSEIALSPGFRWGTSVLAGDVVTMENVLDQTCITYPETYKRNMLGSQIKDILEDVADNLFNKNPYYQQGGDMVRASGINYTLDPLEKFGNRVSDMQLNCGSKIVANKNYSVAGWATVSSQSEGPPIWSVVEEYMKSKDVIDFKKLNTPKLINIAGNPGIA